MRKWLSGGVSPCQGEGRGFESRLALVKNKNRSNDRFLFFCKRKRLRTNTFRLGSKSPLRSGPRITEVHWTSCAPAESPMFFPRYKFDDPKDTKNSPTGFHPVRLFLWTWGESILWSNAQKPCLMRFARLLFLTYPCFTPVFSFCSNISRIRLTESPYG